MKGRIREVSQIITTDRIFLQLLDETPEVQILKNILKSPLGLATEVTRLLFEDDFETLKSRLDKIKKFAAGVKRAETLSAHYSLASYYSYLFSFHQYFHSSYRARQGKVLEEILKSILKIYCHCDQVPEKQKGAKTLLGKLFSFEGPSLDIDALGVNSQDTEVLVIQIRSRDDTGGTTATGSLVDLLKQLIRTGNTPTKPLLYLLGIWDARDAQQRSVTIAKMYSSLQELVAIDKDEFSRQIGTGLEIVSGVTLRMAYGTDEIAHVLFEWSGSTDTRILQSMVEIIHKGENWDGLWKWDDLWIAYAIASLELAVKYIHGHSNVKLLNQKFDAVNASFDFSSYNELTASVDEAANEILRLWTEDSIPLESPAEQLCYIRDLLFLKAYYAKIISKVGHHTGHKIRERNQPYLFSRPSAGD